MDVWQETYLARPCYVEDEDSFHRIRKSKSLRESQRYFDWWSIGFKYGYFNLHNLL
jgi:hypothetical protein